MDFPKSCSTGAVVIDGFSQVPFRVYSVVPTTEDVEEAIAGKERATKEDRVYEALIMVEGALRREGFLVTATRMEMQLWVFLRSSAQSDKLHPDAKGEVLVGDARLIGIWSGIFRASEMAQAAPYPLELGTTKPSNTPAGLTPQRLGAIQPSNDRVRHMNSSLSGLPGVHDFKLNTHTDHLMNQAPAEVYRLLMASILASVTLFYVAIGHIIPLSTRTLLSLPVSQSETDDPESVEAKLMGYSHVSTLEAQLTSAGILIMSSSLGKRLPLRSFADNWRAGNDVAFETLCKFVRVAPSGKIAKVIDDWSVGLQSQSAGEHRFPEAKRWRAQDCFANVEDTTRWKKVVIAWLKSKGISTSTFDSQEKWVRLLCPSSSVKMEESSSAFATDPPYMICLWPAALCFSVALQESRDAHSNNITCIDRLHHNVVQQSGLQWFQTKDHKGFQDPLIFAQNWVLAKAERGKEMERNRLAQEKAQEALETQNVEEELPLDFASPADAPNGIILDFQAASGVYPTPPEALLSQTLTAAAHQDPSVTTPGALNQHSNFEGFPDMAIRTSGSMDSNATPIFPAAREQDRIIDKALGMDSDDLHAGGPDDLFNDMGEDMFGEAGVTDADFSFFDEPQTSRTQADVHSPPNTVPAAPQAEVLATRGCVEHETHGRDLAYSLNNTLGSVGVSRDSGITPNRCIQQDTGARHEEWTQSQLQVVETSQKQGQAVNEHESNLSEDFNVQMQRSRYDIEYTPFTKSVAVGQGKRSSTELVSSTKRQSVFGPVDFGNLHNNVDLKYAVNGRYEPIPVVKPKPKEKLVTTLLSAAQHWDTDTDEDSTDSERAEAAVFEHTFSEIERDSTYRDEELLRESRGRLKRKRGEDDDHSDDYERTVSSTFYNPDARENQQPFSVERNIRQQLAYFEPGALARHLEESAMFMRTSKQQVDTHLSLQKGDIKKLRDLNFAWVSASSDDTFGVIIKDEELSNIALVLMDQVVSSTLLPTNTASRSDSTISQRAIDDDNLDLQPCAASLMLQKVAKHVFPKAREYALLEVAKVPDHDDDGHTGKLQPKPNPRRTNTANNSDRSQDNTAFQIPPPNIRVQRGASSWELLPSSLPFWDSLALGPCCGPKDITAYCIYPSSEELDDIIVQFLDSIGSAYENGKLGDHSRGSVAGNCEPGLVPVGLTGPATLANAVSSIRDTCIELGSKLSNESAGEDHTIVIYLVNPFEDPVSLKYLCSGFWALYETYSQDVRALPASRSRSGLVLQIIPIRFIASFEAPVIPTQDVLAKVAREVYDRCPPDSSIVADASLPIPIAAAVQLGEPPPKTIPFRLIADPPTDLLHENSCLHIAYGMSFDEKWVTAAWTDNYGKYQATVCYCMTGGRMFEEIATEIWETTLDIIRARHVSWRLFIASAGVMEREQVDFWTTLFEATKQPSYIVTLLSVNPNPALALQPAASVRTLPTAGASAGVYSTPALTPQPNTSPNQQGNPPTPANVPSPTGAPEGLLDPPDPNATLLDIADETWGIMLSHRLTNSNSIIDYNPALASAYLVTRGGTTPHDRPSCIAVNLIWCGSGNGGAKSAEGVLREVLVMFRGLAVLARVKGVEDEKRGILPWHVAAVRKGADALERLM